MSAVAPARILNIEKAYRKRADRPKSYRFSGVAGDVNHSFGYHCSPRDLGDDYSLVTKRDRRGAAQHPADASAWDQSYGDADMVRVTRRLLTAAKRHDPRVKAVREFCGTLNGRDTYPWDLVDNRSEGVNSWDSSHLWHVHVSLYRDATEKQIALLNDVLCGKKRTVTQVVQSGTGQVKQAVKPAAPKWLLPDGHYYGPISGPSICHGGYYKSEQPAVRRIQKSLRVRQDGTWGAGTTKAMRAWQAKHKRRVTGVCTHSDWKALVK